METTNITHLPPQEISDEASDEQLKLAIHQGEAYGAAIREMIGREAHGQRTQVGDYLVWFAIEKAKGMYRLENVTLKWEEPGDTNVHIEVIVVDGADGRFIPELAVEVTIIDESGNEVGTERHPFVWHPWIYHYGRNWRVPGDGYYTLRIQIAPPLFIRHDRKNGLRYFEPALVVFENVRIQTGQE